MGYSPDAQARSLVMGRTQTVGVVVTTITDPFIAEAVQGIESMAHDHGYSVILSSSKSEPERELAAVEMLRSKRVDGVIVASSRIGAIYQQHLDRVGVPVVLINSRAREPGAYTYSVMVDNRHGGCLATEHLMQLGHLRIAYVTGPADHGDDQERLAGYRHALSGAAIRPDPALVVPGNGRPGGGERALPLLMALNEPPTAIFCYNDMTAIGLFRAAREMGLSIPQDLAVVGFDDIPFASYVHPALTTIAQPTLDMGRQAMQMMLALTANGATRGADVANIIVQGQLIVRASSGALGNWQMDRIQPSPMEVCG
jgi:DNA-binding LacI/PurR family transcriptional regulator